MYANVGPTLYKCYTNVLCLLGRRAFPQALYTSPILVQCWASVTEVGLTLKQRWVSVSLELYPWSCNQVIATRAECNQPVGLLYTGGLYT